VSKLKLGIPKGSLQQATMELFKKCGWNISVNERSYFPEINDEQIECSICRAQEMSRYVENGTLDVGLTGLDWILENESKIHVVTDLFYSKVSTRPARWVLAVPYDSEIKSIEDCQGKKIATELVSFTRKYFAERNIDVTVEFSWGATEAKAVNGLADAIVEVTETGTTIKAHGLRIIHELMRSNTQLVANLKSWEDPWKRGKIEHIALLMKGALRAEKMVALKMNVPKENVEAIMERLPSLKAPTVAHLYNQEWLSLESVIQKETVRDIIPELIKLGAQGIIEFDLNKVI